MLVSCASCVERECVVEEKPFPACVQSFSFALCLGVYCFHFTSGHSPSYRRRYPLLKHSQFVKVTGGLGFVCAL